MGNYQHHRKALLETIDDLLTAYKTGYSAALESDGATFARIEEALEDCGEVRLYKYQPFNERNLMDCNCGVLHLTPLTELNDVNEGAHRFDIQYAASCLGGIDLEQVSEINFDAIPLRIENASGNNRWRTVAEKVARMKETGALQSIIAPSIAQTLEASFKDMRRYQLCGSLSETVCSASMWDRYADAHRGFAAGYTISPFATNLTRSRNKECTLGLKALIAPVFYGDRLDMTFLASMSQINDRYNPYATNISSLTLAVSLLQKAKEWEHELEWRAIANACQYGTGVHYCKMHPDAIYLGISMQEDERIRAIEVARQNGWRVYQMERSLNSRDWALEGKRIC